MATVRQMSMGYMNNFYNSSATSSVNQASDLTSVLSEYSSISSGAYKKLLKKYYATNRADVTTSAETKPLVEAKENADKLANISNELKTVGSKSVFNKVTKVDESTKTETKEYDKEAIYKKVSSFVNAYNDTVTSLQDQEATSVLRQGVWLTNLTKSNKGMLEDIGITISADNKLTLDEDTFKKADMTKAKSLFEGNNSFGARVAKKASDITKAAKNEATKVNLYNKNAMYQTMSSGKIYDSLF
ncbi:MAG: hypothetical protein U0L23_09870 [Lachnospiraceae bacterium]|nr:hypothetical protein [Lachnospiraceae bacterium]